MKPHLAPLYSWAAAMAPGRAGRLPDTVVLTILYIASELRRKSFLVSAKLPILFGSEVFRTDAKCTDDEVVIAGWECGSDDPRWFAISINEVMAPYLFKPGKGAQWSSASSELLASLAALDGLRSQWTVRHWRCLLWPGRITRAMKDCLPSDRRRGGL